MKLNGIEFGNAFVGAGTLNFFGEGWPFHKYYKHIPGFSFNGATFVSKTTTIDKREGNMKLGSNLQPIKLFPDCIKTYFRKGLMLNAVGLSGPEANALFKEGKWQKRSTPFFISFMAVGPSKDYRLSEAKEFVRLLEIHLPSFGPAIGLEINFSCPNTSHNTEKLIQEASELLAVIRKTGLPISVKVNALIKPESVKKLIDDGLCDAITVSNTIPYGQLPELIDWKGLFGKESPLKKYNGGGLSGRLLLPIITGWIKKARTAGIKIPIIAGGGIQKKEDVDVLINAGASAISICSIAVLRPQRVQGIIDYANHKIMEMNKCR